MKAEKEYPLTSFLLHNNIKVENFIKMSLNNILGLYDKDYIKYIKDKSEFKSHRYSYIRAHGKYHDIVYQDLWNLADKVNEDIYYKEIKTYGFNSYIGKEYIECHI